MFWVKITITDEIVNVDLDASILAVILAQDQNGAFLGIFGESTTLQDGIKDSQPFTVNDVRWGY